MIGLLGILVLLGASRPSGLILAVAAGAVALLLIVLVIVLLVRRSRKRAGGRSVRSNGFAFEATQRSAAPSRFRAETVGVTEVEQPPPPAPEWLALWATPSAGSPPESEHESSVAPPAAQGEPATSPGAELSQQGAGAAEPASAAATPGAPADLVTLPHSETVQPGYAFAVGPAPPTGQVGPSGQAAPVGQPAPAATAADWSPEPLTTAEPGPPAPDESGSHDGNLRGVLRWLLFETDADAVALLQITPAGEHLFIEPRGLPDPAIAELARRGREAIVVGMGSDQTSGQISSTRWLGVGGSKLLLVAGASPIAAAEPLRFARFAVEWLAASQAVERPEASEEAARAVPGVAWAELTADGRLRVLPSEQQAEGSTAAVLGQMLPGQLIRLISTPQAHELERRARLVDVHVTDFQGTPTVEVRLLWEGSELRGVGHGHTSLVGRHMASARAAIDALKPLVHGLMHVEHLQVTTLPADIEVVLVSVLVGDERLVGVTLVLPSDEEKAGAKAVLDALNRRLVVLAGQSGQI